MKIQSVILSFLFCCFIYGQSTFVDRTQKYFTKLWVEVPQEKLYLHTDKPNYSAGEDIWFKAYLVNAATHTPDTKSNFVYVELINEFDSVLNRVKIKKDSLGFSGKITLNAETPQGNYVIRAYTYWMQNAGADFFFSKPIRIGNNIDDRVIANVKFGKMSKTGLPLTLQLLTSNSKPYGSLKIRLEVLSNNKRIKPFTAESNQKGEVYWEIPSDTSKFTSAILKVSSIDQNLKFSRKFKIPIQNEDFDIQFFPESGNLIADNVQVIAFKAIGNNGLSIDVSGKIYNNDNVEITEFKSVYKGLGRFSVFATDSTTYYAVVKSESGFEKKVLLPKISNQGCALQLVGSKSKIYYEIKSNSNNLNTPNKKYLLVHSRGIIYAMQPIVSATGQINEADLPVGITSFSVVDSLGNVYCERLFFAKNPELYNINIRTNKSEFKKHELVNLDFTLKNKLGIPLNGYFSLSVTDKVLVNQDNASNNIITQLLLQSDLKGYIEDPAGFFDNNFLPSSEKLDLLMLTQGWKRFELSSYLKQNYKRPEYYLEMGQAISGKVRNLVNNPSKGCDVIMLSSNNLFRNAVTDSLGQFLIDGIQFPDSTTFLVKARKKKSITDVEVLPDIDLFPQTLVSIPQKTNNESGFENYLKASKEKYFAEGGMRIINLDEFTVTANDLSKELSNPMYADADNRLSANDLQNFTGFTVLDILQTIPGIVVSGETISIRGSSSLPLIMIDGFETDDIADLTHLSVSEIGDIAVFKGTSASIFGSKGGSGAIVVTLKEGVVRSKTSPVSMAILHPLGFQKPVEFYSPKYTVENSLLSDQKSDLRTTIFWADKLKCDQNGNINVQFYTADYAHKYDYILEGITNSGQIIRTAGIINRVE